MNHLIPQDQVWWYLGQKKAPNQLRQIIKTDVVIVGGGMAGLTVAQSFRMKGLDVVLLEKNYCGSGASGKSSGFITPDSEYSLSDLIKLYGHADGQKLWQFVTAGVEIIKNNIKKYSISCDFKVQDTVVVANSKKTFHDDIQKEHKVRQRLGYESTLYTQQNLNELINSSEYFGAVRYGSTFGINAYAYSQGMKEALEHEGVTIYEETPAIALNKNSVTTEHGCINAQYIIVCADYFAPLLGKLTHEIYHAQTFLMLSAPLTNTQVTSIFPDKPCMVWDTDLIYQYYRVTGDNRLMLGGASLLYTYAKHEIHNSSYMARKLSNYFKKKFPHVKPQFEYIWPGLIGITKDIMPIAGQDPYDASLYYIAGTAGLPWAAALGAYSAEALIDKRDDFDQYFRPTRKFPLGPCAQTLMGKKITFALSNFMKLSSL